MQWHDHGSLQSLPPGFKAPAPASQVAGTTGAHHHTWLIYLFLFFVEMGSCYVARAGLKLLGSSEPPASASQSAGITGMSHYAQPLNPLLIVWRMLIQSFIHSSIPFVLMEQKILCFKHLSRYWGKSPKMPKVFLKNSALM